MWQYSSAIGQGIIASPLEYTKAEEYPAAFDDFYKIPNITDTMRLASVWNLTQELAQPEGYR